MLKLILIASLLVALTHGVAIDNGVDGDPQIECGVDSVTVTFRTLREFHGNVYVKGHFADSRCHIGAPSRTTDVEITVPHTNCNTQRTRSLNPAGIQIHTTVVISFHPAFLTKVDRAYAIQCFYMEATKTVNAQIEVSQQHAEVITQTVPMPVCRYEVLRGGPNGAPVRYARIGEAVYHKWTCDSESEGVFCMLVHSCQVSDTDGHSHFLLVDEAGCSSDRHLLQHIQYFGELSAGRETHVFKFADRPQLHFQCQISLVVRENSQQICPVPQCPELPYSESTAVSASNKPHPQTYVNNRKKRDLGAWLRQQGYKGNLTTAFTMDTAAPQINVLDLEDGLDDLPNTVCPNYPLKPTPEGYSGRNEDGTLMSIRSAARADGRVCVSTAAFSIVITATLIVAITTIILITVALYRGTFRSLLSDHH